MITRCMHCSVEVGERSGYETSRGEVMCERCFSSFLATRKATNLTSAQVCEMMRSHRTPPERRAA